MYVVVHIIAETCPHYKTSIESLVGNVAVETKKHIRVCAFVAVKIFICNNSIPVPVFKKVFDWLTSFFIVNLLVNVKCTTVITYRIDQDTVSCSAGYSAIPLTRIVRIFRKS